MPDFDEPEQSTIPSTSMELVIKYKPNTRVFFMHENKVTQGVVKHIGINIRHNDITIVYHLAEYFQEKNQFERRELQVFSTKEALLASL